jgi:pilus assembly protein Flp/PilA
MADNYFSAKVAQTEKPSGKDRAISMFRNLRSIIRDNKGATAIEYGLIAALIAVAAIGAMTSLGTKLGRTFNNVSGNLR